MHSLCTCNHIVHITYLLVYISIYPSKVYVLYSHHIGMTKFVLSINPIILLVCNALVEPLVGWRRHGMFYDL